MKRTIQRLAALVAVGTIALAGCAGGDSDDAVSTSESSQGGGEAGDADEAAPSSDATGSDTAGDEDASSGSTEADSSDQEESDSDQDSDSAKDPAGTHIARSAGLTVTVSDVERASAKVRAAATSSGGYVSSEETRIADEDGSTGSEPSSSTSAPGSGSTSGDHTPPPRSGAWAQIVVTVPVDELDSTMTELAEVGTVTQRTSDAEDLSKQYTDTRSRVRTMKKSVARLQALIDDTDDLEQIVTLEDELAQRESDLESMVSQQKSLEKRTTTAPITVSLVSPEAAEEEDEDTEETGFVAGLKGGWHAFSDALEVTLTVLGAVTPFALIGLALLAPVTWWLRRRSRRTSAVTKDPVG